MATYGKAQHSRKEPQYRGEYFNLFEPNRPTEGLNDRNHLYCIIKDKVIYSTYVPDTAVKGTSLGDMLYLIHKSGNYESLDRYYRTCVRSAATVLV
ncbi:unnamed protein product [Penicillium camemberti]|uniref:Str. FM013 n=1 Tax=Penicillium camemberti (strain FM 013) TaxID=1429867 RepID=A0A0G4PLS5_PENC3|nr:unnamed protein product [Penicillium camemberti]